MLSILKRMAETEVRRRNLGKNNKGQKWPVPPCPSAYRLPLAQEEHQFRWRPYSSAVLLRFGYKHHETCIRSQIQWLLTKKTVKAWTHIQVGGFQDSAVASEEHEAAHGGGCFSLSVCQTGFAVHDQTE
jgi:hypothetical protein